MTLNQCIRPNVVGNDVALTAELRQSFIHVDRTIVVACIARDLSCIECQLVNSRGLLTLSQRLIMRVLNLGEVTIFQRIGSYS
jgi:hypothetical protein